MSASQQVRGVDVSDGASRSNVHVAADENCTDSGTGHEWVRLFLRAYRADAHHGYDPLRGELRSKFLNRIFREPAEHKRSVDGLQIVGEALHRGAGDSWAGCLRSKLRQRLCLDRNTGRSCVDGADLEHLGNRGHAGDRLLREFPDSERNRARELAVEIDRAAAHSGNNAGVLGLGPTQADKNNVALRSIGVLQHTQNLDWHWFRLSALKNGIGDTMHSGLDLGQREGRN